jgi:hypothetical protein
MTGNSESAYPSDVHGELIRAADHVLAVPAGSALAILDFEHGHLYATTPFGAGAWRALVEGQSTASCSEGSGRDELGGELGTEEGPVALARVAAYLLARRLIEPALRGATDRG